MNKVQNATGCFLAQLHSSFFFSVNSFCLEPKVTNSWIFQKRTFIRIICDQVSIQTLLFQTCLPTRQDGFQNRNKVYLPRDWYLKVPAIVDVSSFAGALTAYKVYGTSPKVWDAERPWPNVPWWASPLCVHRTETARRWRISCAGTGRWNSLWCSWSLSRECGWSWQYGGCWSCSSVCCLMLFPRKSEIINNKNKISELSFSREWNLSKTGTEGMRF